MAYRAFLDANVLVPARVRDVLLTSADVGAFAPIWSPEVFEEVDRHLPAAMYPASRDHLFREMDRAFPEASTTWPEPLHIEVAAHVNSHDHHVMAAALWAHADVLVTDDQRLADEATPLIDCQSPGLFVTYALDAVGTEALSALLEMARQRWSRGDQTDGELADRLRAWMRSLGWDGAASELARLSGAP